MTKTDSGNVESDSGFNETSESHSRAQTEAVEVEMKERLLVHPAGRWYDEVLEYVW